jgi:hypothetical protein
MVAPALSLAEDTAMLTLEALTVIAIRLTQLSCGGPAAEVEAQRMVRRCRPVRKRPPFSRRVARCMRS